MKSVDEGIRGAAIFNIGEFIAPKVSKLVRYNSYLVWSKCIEFPSHIRQAVRANYFLAIFGKLSEQIK